jgi:hypothetical protein
VDVREQQELIAGMIPSAIHLSGQVIVSEIVKLFLIYRLKLYFIVVEVCALQLRQINYKVWVLKRFFHWKELS